MFQNVGDRTAVEQAMQSWHVHPDEIERVVALGQFPETFGQELVVSLPAMQAAGWYRIDLDDPKFMVTNEAHAPAIDAERRVVLGIGLGGAVSHYERLFIGCTAVDAPPDADVVHVNVTAEDMRFSAQGPRILIDGRFLPLPSQFFRHSEGSHVPFDRNLTPSLVRELFRTLRHSGTVRYAPSTNYNDVVKLLDQQGFTGVRLAGFARRTHYRGMATLPTFIIEATRP